VDKLLGLNDSTNATQPSGDAPWRRSVLKT